MAYEGIEKLAKKSTEVTETITELKQTYNRVDIKYVGDYEPQYAHSGDSGFDFICLEKTRVYPGQTVLIKTGLYFEIPEGFEVQVRPRSGLSLRTKLRVANSPGTIDSGYRNEVGVIITNHGKEKVILQKGEKFAQGVVCPVFRANFIKVDKLENSERGLGGFGSTDRKEVK
jgi:dUTP pyrophosphatase